MYSIHINSNTNKQALSEISNYQHFKTLHLFCCPGLEIQQSTINHTHSCPLFLAFQNFLDFSISMLGGWEDWKANGTTFGQYKLFRTETQKFSQENPHPHVQI